MKFAILGASGIGRFHIRELIKLNNKITCILGSTKESAKDSANKLNLLYGINVNYYWNIDDLLDNEKIDAVDVCTPPFTHYNLAKKCLDRGLHVFCEKPFVESSSEAKELIQLAKNKGVVLMVNTQWTSFLKYIDIPKNISTFKLYSEPGSSGVDFVKDHLPHAISLLIKLIPDGKIKNLNFPINEKEKIVINFNFSNKITNCNVSLTFSYKKDRPRRIGFEINGSNYKRELDKAYNHYLVFGNNSIKIEDPLFTSIKSFADSINKNKEPLNNSNEVLENVKTQELIIKNLIQG